MYLYIGTRAEEFAHNALGQDCRWLIGYDTRDRYINWT